MRIVWIGNHSEGLAAFESLCAGAGGVTRFITLDEAAFARRSAGSRDYLDICRRWDIPVSYVSTIKDEAAYALVRAEEPELVVVMGWSEILPARLLALPKHGTVGTHAAMLPHNRGSAPINWALIRGERTCGNSMMWLTADVDAGCIIDQEGFDITPYDTCKTLYDKVAVTNEHMLLRLIDRLERGLPPVMERENVSDEPLLPRRRPKDGDIDWSGDSESVYNFIRALTRPYPGAFTELNGARWWLWSAALPPERGCAGAPGTILGSVVSPVDACCGIQVACGSGTVLLGELEDAQGKVYAGRALAELGLSGRFERAEQV